MNVVYSLDNSVIHAKSRKNVSEIEQENLHKTFEEIEQKPWKAIHASLIHSYAIILSSLQTGEILMIAESTFGVAILAGIGSSLGNAGISALYKLTPQIELEIGAGYSSVSDLNIAANVYYIWNQDKDFRQLAGLGYNLSFDRRIDSSRGTPLLGESPNKGSSYEPFNETATYKGHWINTCWGLEFGNLFSYGFLVGAGFGYVESAKGGEVFLQDGKYYRRKHDYEFNKIALTFVPVRISFRF